MPSARAPLARRRRVARSRPASPAFLHASPSFRYTSSAFLPDPPDLLTERRLLQFGVIGRLAPGTTVAEAQAAADTLATMLQRTYPEVNRDRSVRLISLQKGAGAQPNLH